MWIDEIAEYDFQYLADELIYEEIANQTLKTHIDMAGGGLKIILFLGISYMQIRKFFYLFLGFNKR